MKNGGQGSNAVVHGLTARQRLPAALEQETAKLQRRLEAELAPVSAVEEILVREVARHGAALQFAAAAEPAVLRTGAACETTLNVALGENGAPELDRLFAAAVTSDGVEKLSRYRRQHERALYQALSVFERVRSQGKASRTDALLLAFAEESACRDYLRSRVKEQGCRRCGHSAGSFLQTRDRHECANCRAQSGLRTGTVMENSPLPLVVWFRAILLLSASRDLAPAELATSLGVSRLSTVRSMAKKIRAAASQPEADHLLAGLPGLLLSRTPVGAAKLRQGSQDVPFCETE